MTVRGVWGKILEKEASETTTQSISHARHFFKNPFLGISISK